MIPPISNATASQTLHRAEQKSAFQGVRELSSIESLSLAKVVRQKFCMIFGTIFSFLGRFVDWIVSKFALSDKEQDAFRDIIENLAKGALLLAYQRSLGEAQLLKVIESCDDMYKICQKKLIPSIRGIRFVKQNLVAIKLRCYAALGDKKEVKNCKKILQSLGIKNHESLDKEVKHALAIMNKKKLKSRALVKGLNVLVQGLYYIFSKVHAIEDI